MHFKFRPRIEQSLPLLGQDKYATSLVSYLKSSNFQAYLLIPKGDDKFTVYSGNLLESEEAGEPVRKVEITETKPEEIVNVTGKEERTEPGQRPVPELSGTGKEGGRNKGRSRSRGSK